MPNEKVLIVDDEQSIRLFLNLTLTSQGYETIEAAWEGEIAPIADAIANNEILQQIDPLFQGYLNHLFDDDFGAIAGEPCLVQAWNLAHMGERNKAVCYAYLSFKYADCP